MNKIILLITLFTINLCVGQTFTDTKGTLEISNSGQATYTLPIAMPPSIKNVAPIIDLTYNSGKKGGIAGQGWSINSISSISRIATRKDIDGFIDGVDFDFNDKLALDGQRLIIKTGLYWNNGSVYETEFKSNLKIELKIEGVIKYFIVTNPDGSRSWYGSSGNGNFQNAISENSWYIVRYEDPIGNYISYEYTNVIYNNSNQWYISEIKFSGNQIAGVTQANKIVFNYEPAKRIEVDYINGKAVYASKILSNIEVKTNDNPFRKYLITRDVDDSGYERVTQIKEINGEGESSNPVTLEYYSTPTQTNKIEKTYDNNLGFESIKVAGDFDGDSRLDFIANNKLYNNLFVGDSGNTPYIYAPNDCFAATTITNNKLNQFQSLVSYSNDDLNTELKVHNLEGNQFVYKYSKNIPINRNTTNTFTSNTGSTYGLMCAGYFENYYPPNAHNTGVSYYEGDFDGNGISEVLIAVGKVEYHVVNGPVYLNPMPSTFDPELCNITKTQVVTSKYYLVDLNPNSSIDYVEISNINIGIGIINNVTDFNGDGKSDILTITNDGDYKIYSYTAYGNQFEIIGQGVFVDFSFYKQRLIGDYNGDGKNDIMMPTTEGCSGCNGWIIYYSNPNPAGGEFFVTENFNIDEYWPNSDDYFETQTHFSSYYAMDVNKDGKSDFVRVWRKYYKPYSDPLNPATWTINDHNTKWSVSVYTNNIGKAGTVGGFEVTYYSGEFYSGSPDIPIPIAANYKYHGQNTDLVIVRGHYNKIEYYQFEKNFNTDNRLKSVTESNGNIKQTIEYLPMHSLNESLGEASVDFYSSTNSCTYPDIEIIKNSENYLVSKLTATINGVSKYQDFKYRSFVSNFNYGDIGFKRTARSSWYLTSGQKLWTIQENDITKRGANTKTWTSKSDSSVFASVPSDLVSTKTNVFETYTNPTTKIYNLLLKQQITKDENTGVKIEKNFTYDGDVNSASYFGLETQVQTKYFDGTTFQGSSTSITEYDNNQSGGGSSYYIGRPKSVFTTNIISGAGGSDTRTSEEKYFYSGSNLTRLEKKGHNTDYIVEEMGYDPLGNLNTKTVSMPTSIPPVAARTIIDVYDPSGRFVVTKTDHQGFVSLLEYNSLGQVVKSTDHMGVINDFQYDNWGKLIENKTTGISTTQKIITTVYNKNNDGGYHMVEKNTSGTNEINTTRYDVLGRVIQKTTKAFENDILLFTSIEYDGLGRKKREWEPYFNTPSKKTEYEYDDLSRLIKVTYPTGKIQNISYSSLTTISDDDGRISTATLDAMGNKIQTTDEGGTVNFSYYANGQLRNSGFEGNNVTIEIDGWGNKKSINDPNAGIYTYEYDGFGQLLIETNLKGDTNYEYDSFGKLIKKTMSGDGTDFIIHYTYNNFAQLTHEESKNSVNAAIDSYDYAYDSLHRLSSTTENNNALEHIKTITYDDHGRVLTENNTTREKLSNFSSAFLTKYHYNSYNGIMYKTTDANDAVLWQLNTANEKMQPLRASLGNGVEIINTYTSDFYLYLQLHKKNQSYILSNTFDFEPKRGNLRSRFNGVISEFFTYDNMDRLVSWTNPITNAIDYNGYDSKGRITLNNKVGDVRYNTDANTGLYRKDNIKLNPEGQLYYGALGGNMIVNYTMFKSPISINESNKGKMDFEYNSHLSRTKMMYDYGLIAPSTVKEQRKTKLYTDDGASEVIYDNVANTIKILTYVGGDAYDAMLYIDKTLNRSNNVTTEKKYYLHRDHLGSILAITDELGNTVEKRHFDAWGNLTSIVNASGGIGDVANGLQFFDRGYTSHEHLKEVRLIHMNGRLYDPMLRSFMMPDNFVQQPENTQNYNRYAYCLNNPLKYTDPSGEELVAAILIGAAIAAATYTITAALADVPFNVSGLAGATFIGAASAAVTFGIGNASGFVNFYSKAAFQAFAHGTFQGGMTAIQGGKFWNGFAAGALSSIASSAWSGGSTTSTTFEANSNLTSGHFVTETISHQGISGAIGAGSAGMIAFGTIAGGAGAALTGGNFWQGAATGLVVSGLNHAMHQIDGDNGYDKNGNKVDDRGGDNIDYKYGDDGSIVSSTNVQITGSEGAVAQRGYGYKMYMAKGGLNEDYSVFGLYAGGKIAGAGLSLAGSAITSSSRIAGYVVRNASWLNKGNWWRLGEGTGKGAGMIRLSLGAHPNYIHQVPKILRPLNQWIRNNFGKNGHFDYPNWR